MEALSLARRRTHLFDPARKPAHGARWLARARLAAFAMVLAATQAPPAFAEPTEQEVKAALIFNITRFVGWPETAFDSPSAPLVVAIMGKDDVSEVLEPMLQHKSVNGHPLEMRHVRTVDEAQECQVLYVAGSEKRHADSILQAMRGTSTLTVANIEHFAERGGHINLMLEDRRVRVFVNPTSAEESHLTISAKLLSVAQIVGATR